MRGGTGGDGPGWRGQPARLAAVGARRAVSPVVADEAVLRVGEGVLDFFGAAFWAAPDFVAVFAAMVGLLGTAARVGPRETRAAV